MTEPLSPQENKPSEKIKSVVKDHDNGGGGDVSLLMMAQRAWNAPIPSPEDFNKYPEPIQNRIMDVAENESKHRHEQEKKSLDATIKYDYRGQLYVFVIIIISVLASVVLVFNGYRYGLLVLLAIIPTLTHILKALEGLFRSQKKE